MLAAPEKRGSAIAIVTGGLTLATALGVPLGIAVAAYGDWRLSFVLVGAMSLIGVIGVAFGLPGHLPRGASSLRDRFLVAGRPGVLHGTKTYLLQDADGQILETHSISAGLDYPGVGPEHSWLKTSERAEYVAVDDKQALEGFQSLTRSEGIIPALEPSHAIYHAMKVAKELRPDQDVLVGLSGRGDKDMHTVAAALGVTL